VLEATSNNNSVLNVHESITFGTLSFPPVCISRLVVLITLVIAIPLLTSNEHKVSVVQKLVLSTMPPNSLIELNRSLFHSHHLGPHETKEEEDRMHNNNNSNHNNSNDSWLSCALASHGTSNTASMSSSKGAAAVPQDNKKQTIASMAMEDARVTQQSQLLESMVSTLTAKLKTQDQELKQFPVQHERYVELFLALEGIKEQLECAVYENLQLKRRAKGLEAALAVQDIELDDHSSRMWNVAAMEKADNEKKEALKNKIDANAAADKNQEGNQQEQNDKRNKMERKLDKLEGQRDTAVKQATQLAIQLAESQLAVDDLRDKLIECKVVTEFFQHNNHNSAEQLKIVDQLPSNKMSFFTAMFSGTSTPQNANPNQQIKGGAACESDYDEENDETENLSVSSISQESIVRLQQVHFQSQQQLQPPQQQQPSENGSTLEGLDYAPSTADDHNYL
jgi:hypothetical protein